MTDYTGVGIFDIGINWITGQSALTDGELMTGRAIGGGLGGIFGGIAANLGSDLIPALRTDFNWYGTVLVGMIGGALVLGPPVALFIKATRF